jgi:hypothetical protein
MSKMIFIPRLLPLLVFILLFPACNSDIDLFNESQEKNYVVFGLLNTTDPVQQVKVRMTSVTDTPANQVVVDSSEFAAPSGLQVTIQEWNQGYYATYPLQAVIYPKEAGIFMNIRNDLYETEFVPIMDMTYKLLIVNPANGDVVESKIVPVPVPRVGSPTWSWVRHNFSNEADPFNIRFNEVPRVYVYIARFTLRYIDVLNSGDTILRNASWAFDPRYSDDPPDYTPIRENRGREHNIYVNQSYAYRVFDELIPDIADLHFRQLICFDISVWGGDQNLRNYTELGIKFNDNRKHVFSNISNGIGFFGACSHKDCEGVLPDQDFMDSLSIYVKTSRLKFRPELYRPDNLDPTKPVDFLSLIPEIKK